MKISIDGLLRLLARGGAMGAPLPPPRFNAQYTKKGPGRIPANGKSTRRRAPLHGEGSLMELDREVSRLLADPDLEGEKILRQETQLRKLAEIRLNLPVMQ